MKALKKFGPLLAISSCAMIVTPLVVSCNSERVVHYDYIVNLEDLFYDGYERKTQIIPEQPQEKISEDQAVNRYLRSVNTNYDILVDDILSSFAYTEAWTETTPNGKIGISIRDVNVEKGTISMDFGMFNACFEYYDKADDLFVIEKYDGRVSFNNIPITIYNYDYQSEYFPGPQWWLVFDINKIIDSTDVNWSFDIDFVNTWTAYDLYIELPFKGYYDMHSSEEALLELASEIAIYLEEADTPLEFMKNVAVA